MATTMANYASVTGYNLQFLDHSNPEYNSKGAVEQMDNYYGEFVTDATFHEMFDDGATRTQVKKDVMAVLRRHVQEIVVRVANQTTQAARVPPILNRWTYKYERRLGRYTNLRGDIDFRKLLQKAIDNGETEVDIYIVWGSTYINYDGAIITYKNFDDFSNNPFPGPAGVPVVPGNVPPGVAGGAFALAAGRRPFNPVTLPAGPQSVKARYDKFIDESKHIRRSDISTFNDTGLHLRYYIDGVTGDSYVLRNGQVYRYMGQPDFKAFSRQVPKCYDTSAAGVYQWYNLFVGHCHQHGIYAHPYVLMNKTGGPQGFTCGLDEGYDLPSFFTQIVRDSNYPIWQLLSRDDVFPKGSKYKSVVAQYSGRGYEALKAIVMDTHPKFSEHPGLLIANPPVQLDGQTLSEYWMVWQFYLAMKALVHDEIVSLDNVSAIDIFIQGCIDRDYFFNHAREDRKSHTLAHKFRTITIVETLMEYMKYPGFKSIGKNMIVTRPPPLYDTAASRTEKRVYHIGEMEIDRSPIDVFSAWSSDSAELLTPTKLADEGKPAALNLLTHESLPFDAAAGYTPEHYYGYFHAINRLARDTDSMKDRTCLVCSGGHPFDDCPVLRNNDFLKDHYIRFSSFLKKELINRQTKTNVLPPIPTGDRVKKVNLVEFRPDPVPTGQDFYYGQK
jgi:hypothetical protein